MHDCRILQNEPGDMADDTETGTIAEQLVGAVAPANVQVEIEKVCRCQKSQPVRCVPLPACRQAGCVNKRQREYEER